MRLPRIAGVPIDGSSPTGANDQPFRRQTMSCMHVLTTGARRVILPVCNDAPLRMVALRYILGQSLLLIDPITP